MLVILFGVQVLSCSSTPSTCVTLGQPHTALQGTLRIEDMFGPPNFGQTPATDEKIRVPIIHLKENISICETSGSTVSAPPASVDRIQLIGLEGQNLRDASHIAVEGELIPAENAFHFTDIVMINTKSGSL